MNRMLLEGERKALQSRLDILNRVEPNCHTCIKLEQSGYCQQHKSSVPDDFKTTGCDEWEWTTSLSDLLINLLNMLSARFHHTPH